MSPINEWQTRAADARFTAPDQCAARAGKDAAKFARQIRIRNWIEYAAGALAVTLFTGTAMGAFWKGETLIGLASLAIVAGVALAMVGLARRGSNLERLPEETCLTHLRRQYQHQYDALSSIAQWYIGPFVPGLVLFYLAITARVAEQIGWTNALIGIAGPFAISAAIFGVILLANWWAARALKSKIEGLDELA